MTNSDVENKSVVETTLVAHEDHGQFTQFGWSNHVQCPNCGEKEFWVLCYNGCIEYAEYAFNCILCNEDVVVEATIED